jgi:hypothetical protein
VILRDFTFYVGSCVDRSYMTPDLASFSSALIQAPVSGGGSYVTPDSPQPTGLFRIYVFPRFERFLDIHHLIYVSCRLVHVTAILNAVCSNLAGVAP